MSEPKRNNREGRIRQARAATWSAWQSAPLTHWTDAQIVSDLTPSLSTRIWTDS